MAKRKSIGHGKQRSSGKRTKERSPELDSLQDRFNSMDVDFSQLAAVLGHQ